MSWTFSPSSSFPPLGQDAVQPTSPCLYLYVSLIFFHSSVCCEDSDEKANLRPFPPVSDPARGSFLCPFPFCVCQKRFGF